MLSQLQAEKKKLKKKGQRKFPQVFVEITEAFCQTSLFNISTKSLMGITRQRNLTKATVLQRNSHATLEI